MLPNQHSKEAFSREMPPAEVTLSNRVWTEAMATDDQSLKQRGPLVAIKKYLQEGVHLLLHPVDEPPLDHQAVADGEERFPMQQTNFQSF